MNDVLTLILGGGRGTRLYPLTHMRSKPAVPIGGKYRLIDIPISNCLHAGLKRIYVLTQFNSASLNRHVAQTYRLDLFSEGFVEVLAAEQTPDNANWFQGTADAVRQASRHFEALDASYYLILAGDHLYRMDFCELIDSHIESQADITIAAQPVDRDNATQMGIFRFDVQGRIAGFEEKPNAARLSEIKSSAPRGAVGGLTPDKPFVASMGIYVFSRDVLHEILKRPGVDFGKEIIPAALDSHHVQAYLYRGYWADVGTIDAFYEANIQLTRPGAPFNFFDPQRPIYTHPRFLPSTRALECRAVKTIIAEGCYLDTCEIEESVVGIRSHIGAGSKVTRSILLGADYYQSENAGTDGVGLGIGRDVVLDRVIVDKNARIADGVRLVNDTNVRHADGDGYYIRDGIIVVPKGAVVRASVRA
ncbi:MAG TPA: glucose-1-phosphate adenylyltransferase [Vicinamibacterales bacterium]|jgi:glucose-1-phosphate adenylyltransferase|nr:glucose-1-phosphate adenylyltransferase [Vicinamibacterales bacterium]